MASKMTASKMTATAVLAAAFWTLGLLPAAAGEPESGPSGDRATGTNNGDTVTGTAEDDIPGIPADTSEGGNGGPNCTRSDGTPDYLRYEGLKYTTMEEQRTEIRPEEQRPGQYLHVYCGEEYIDFVFVPEGQQVDPTTLARTVTIRPAAPVIHTSPAAGDHLVGVEAWFWVSSWDGISRSATAGSVTVTVSAQPTSLVIDPGDGSPTFTCPGPGVAFDPARPASAQSSDCTHTYVRAGNYTATATVVYEVSFTSNVGVDGDLGTIEPSSTLDLAVAEAQAINTRGAG